jgi:hypothetical protein
MNERYKELAEQAGIGYLYEYEMKWAWLGELEHFAELVRQDEREACAKLCDAVDAAHEGDYVLAKWCAEAIRARGNHD